MTLYYTFIRYDIYYIHIYSHHSSVIILQLKIIFIEQWTCLYVIFTQKITLKLPNNSIIACNAYIPTWLHI